MGEHVQSTGAVSTSMYSPNAKSQKNCFFNVSYLTFEAIEGGRLKSMTPGLFLLEDFQQPLSLIQIRVCLQRSEMRVSRDPDHRGAIAPDSTKAGEPGATSGLPSASTPTPD